MAEFLPPVVADKAGEGERLAVALVSAGDTLLIGGPSPDGLEQQLHPYVTERLAGSIEGVDVSSATPAGVLETARPILDAHRSRSEQEALERLRAGLARDGGRAVAGRDDVFAMLEQQRVEKLLLGAGVGDEDAVDLALAQSAAVLEVRESDELAPHGGIAALLRF